MSSSPVPDVFKAYDIRGLYAEQIDGDLAEKIGGAFAHVLAALAGKPAGELRVGLGSDMRLSAPELAKRYASGLLGAGADVLDIGEVGTEMLYFLVGSRGLDGGLMCTASHNPKAYTGAKLVGEGALALSGDSGIAEVRRLVESAANGIATGARAGGGHVQGEKENARSPALQELDIYEDFQAAALAFRDVVSILVVVVVCLIPLAFIMKKPPRAGGDAPPAH